MVLYRILRVVMWLVGQLFARVTLLSSKKHKINAMTPLLLKTPSIIHYFENEEMKKVSKICQEAIPQQPVVIENSFTQS